ncbi:MAG: DUF4465 domain-containing protein [Bacteroidota bacterium]|nr:DUF4465 domain-containing protein [Bacteroidota bacterium]
MMKKISIAFASFALAGCFFVSGTMAQNTAGFENLNLENESYYDGGQDYSGSGETESFYYASGGVNFTVNFTDWGGGMTSYSGMAYSNETDLSTADNSNYSAYATPAGGANGSANYGVFYPSYTGGDSIFFDDPVNIEHAWFTNHVWTYHYINGSDGIGEGEFQAGDSMVLNIIAYDESDQITGDVEIDLADFTGSNTYIMDNWTEVDLSSLENVKYLKFEINSSDDLAPTYFCIDDLTYTNLSANPKVEKEQVNVYPVPFNDKIHIDGAGNAHYKLYDACGKLNRSGALNSGHESLYAEDLPTGMYFIHIDTGEKRIIRKMIK